MSRLSSVLLLAISLFVTLLSCSRKHTEPITGKTVDMTNPHVSNGKVLYDQYCYKCHPSGGGGLAPEVIGKPGFARRFQVRHGLGVMPAFRKDEIGKPQLDDIMAYLNALRRL
jgi:mono/diheme cytochrome c family protein